MTTTLIALAPSEAVALFAPQFVGEPKLSTGTYELPDQAGTVALVPLAETALKTALLALERDGRIRLDVGTKKVLFGLGKGTAVFADAPPEAASLRGAPPLGRLEEGLLDVVTAADEPVEVDELVYRWIGEDQSSPPGWVLEQIDAGLVSRGVLAEQAEQKKVLFFKTTRIHLVFPEGIRQALPPDAATEVHALLQGARARGELWVRLDKEIKQGLARRREYDDAPDFD